MGCKGSQVRILSPRPRRRFLSLRTLAEALSLHLLECTVRAIAGVVERQHHGEVARSAVAYSFEIQRERQWQQKQAERPNGTPPDARSSSASGVKKLSHVSKETSRLSPPICFASSWSLSPATCGRAMGSTRRPAA